MSTTTQKQINLEDLTPQLLNLTPAEKAKAMLLDNYPILSAQDLVNTWSYAEKFSEEIEYDIWENEYEFRI